MEPHPVHESNETKVTALASSSSSENHDHHVMAILKAAGAFSDDDTSFSSSAEMDPIQAMEEWLGCCEGMDEDNMRIQTTIEECVPFADDVYGLISTWLIDVWSHSTLFSPSHEEDPSLLSLDRCMESVRTTRWVCAWMEFNLQDRASEDDVRLMQKLLSVTSSNNKQLQHDLLRALFKHMQELPFLLQQIHAWIQRYLLSPPPPSDTTTPQQQSTSNTSTTTSYRLQHYQTVQTLRDRFQTEWDDHLIRLTSLLGDAYEVANASQRRYMRRSLGHLWTSFVHNQKSHASRENTQAVAIRPSLVLLQRILLGSSSASLQKEDSTTTSPAQPQQSPHQELLLTLLVDLHKPDGIVLWRDQAPVLEQYHEVLCQCIGILLQQQKDATVFERFLQLLVPTVKGNSAKQVLLLHEIDTYLRLLPSPEHDATADNTIVQIVLPLLAQCIQSDHSRVAEQALQFFRRTNKDSLLFASPYVMTHETLWKALVRAQPSWNPTVRKMTATVLELFQEQNPTLFQDTCNRFFSHQAPSLSLGNSQPPQHPVKSSSNPMMTLPRRYTTPKAPPASTTTTPRWTRGSGQPPPLTVTGVAPWAQKQNPQQSSLGVATAPRNKRPVPSTSTTSFASGFEYVTHYMRQLKPPPPAFTTKTTLMSETPTFLPQLRFHDLVFGHELGRGSFGTVVYARHIHRQETRSSAWPEYAVKILPLLNSSSFSEIAILSLVSHPGVARLVSWFSFRDKGVYLVLEYASGGDLHSVLRRQGSLDKNATQSVIGQVVAALDSLHEDLQLVFGDLKPENIVVTETCHVKLTDFGACRAVAVERREQIDALAKELKANLRDGDWKTEAKGKRLTKNGFVEIKEEEDNGWGTTDSEAKDTEGTDDYEDELENNKIEGTTAYLPPEVVMGEVPTVGADAWALGCVLYQCLTGRPPLLADNDEATKHRIVHFDPQQDPTSGTRDDSAGLFSGKHAQDIDEGGRSLILSLLDRDHLKRPGMKQVASHDFFSGVNVFSLYKQPAAQLESGSVTPEPNAKWSRRQFSSIWAPQPKAYNISMTGFSSRGIRSDGNDTTAIQEGEEKDGYYTVSQKGNAGGGIRTRFVNVLPPSS